MPRPSNPATLLRRPSTPIASRDFQADLDRLAGSVGIPSTAAASSAGTLGTAPGAVPPGTAGAAASTPTFSAEAAVGGGPRAARIYEIARGLIGTSNALYYGDTHEACASFVSTVLIRAGVMPQSSFTRSAKALTQVTEAAGAVNVFGLIPITSSSILRSQPGDVVQLDPGAVVEILPNGTFRAVSGNSIGHSGIADGKGNIVAIESSAGHIGVYAINYRVRGAQAFVRFQLHRFGG